MWRKTNTQKKLFEAINNEKIFFVFDVETTGFSATKDRIIQFSGSKYKIIGHELNKVDTIDVYIKPPFLISEKIENITHITNEFLMDKPNEENVFESIKNFVGDDLVLCAYNSPFDIRMLKALFERNGLELKYFDSLDILDMARDLIPKEDTENFQLETISKLYGFADTVFHSAINDSEVEAKLMQEFIYEYQKKEEDDDVLPKTRAVVLSCQYWSKFTKRIKISRIYVNTNLGTVYFDIYSQAWGEKDKGCMEVIDMESLQNDVFVYTHTTDYNELSKWRDDNAS